MIEFRVEAHIGIKASLCVQIKMLWGKHKQRAFAGASGRLTGLPKGEPEWMGRIFFACSLRNSSFYIRNRIAA